MGFFSSLGNFLDRVFDALIGIIGFLLATAIEIINAALDFVQDVIGWIKEGLNSLLDEGATEVNVIKGSAFAKYINEQKALGNANVRNISDYDVDKIRKGVISVATDKNGQEVKTQIITSRHGLSAEANEEFGDKSMITIQI